jgi:hypothetical protein
VVLRHVPESEASDALLKLIEESTLPR